MSICSVAGYSNRGSTCRWVGCCIVDTHIDLTIVGIDETLRLSRRLCLIAHKAMGGVRTRVEVEVVEEVAAVIGGADLVGCCSVLMKSSSEIRVTCGNGTDIGEEGKASGRSY